MTSPPPQYTSGVKQPKATIVNECRLLFFVLVFFCLFFVIVLNGVLFTKIIKIIVKWIEKKS